MSKIPRSVIDYGWLVLALGGAFTAFVVGSGLNILEILGIILLLSLISTVFVLFGWNPNKSDKFPDNRSDYNKRVWADDHNFEADGDSDHNYEGDGDYPW